MAISSIIADNVQRVLQRVAEAARRSGRSAEEITVIAVSKYVGVAEIQALIEAGCRDLGESRPQDLWVKAAALADAPVRWHQIGHLQRNKIRRTLPLVSLVHSGDSLRLLDALNQEAAVLGRHVPVLLEVNVSGDDTKHGFRPEEMPQVVESVRAFTQLEIRGLMAMAGREGDLGEARRDFSRLRTLQERLRPMTGLPLDQLSMGMSDDFEVAIEEGATMIRVGSILFEGLDS